MKENEYVALLNYIDARINEKIEDAFGRDGLNESVRRSHLQEHLHHLLVIVPTLPISD